MTFGMLPARPRACSFSLLFFDLQLTLAYELTASVLKHRRVLHAPFGFVVQSDTDTDQKLTFDFDVPSLWHPDFSRKIFLQIVHHKNSGKDK